MAKDLRKNAVLVKDAPAFVVNRVLLRMMGEVLATVDEGTPVKVADAALAPLGLPMPPFVLMQLVGLPIVLHVGETLHAAFGDRFPVSPSLKALIEAKRTGVYDWTADGETYVSDETQALLPVGDRPSTAEQVRERALAAVAEEIGLMLADGRGRRADGRRPLPDPGRGLAVPPRRDHALPGSRRHLRAGARTPVPAAGRGQRRRLTFTPGSTPHHPRPRTFLAQRHERSPGAYCDRFVPENGANAHRSGC